MVGCVHDQAGGVKSGDVPQAIFDAAPDPVTGAGDVFRGAAEVLRQTEYADACPIATVALEVASSNETLRMATADVFDSWIESATRRFTGAGIPAGKARALAFLLVEMLEGAFLLSRAMRTTEPMEVAGEAAAAAIRAALPARRAGRRRESVRA